MRGISKPYQLLLEGLLSVDARLLAVAAHGLVRCYGFRGIHADETDRLEMAVDLYGDGVSVGDLLDLAVDLVCAAEMVEEAVEAHHRDGGEQERKDEDDSDEYRLRSRAGEDAVLVAAGENGYGPAGPEELDSSKGHHVGEEVRAETDEDGYPGRRVVHDPA